MHASNARIAVDLVRRTADLSGALQLELVSRSSPLPRFKAGAHIDLFLPNGMIRSYSLMNDEAETNRYVVGVGRDRNSRGGSAYIHDHLVENSALTISQPKNLFPLHEDAVRTVMFAGGIGVTPFLAMIERLEALGREWVLYYCARSREQGPFFARLSKYLSRVRTRFDDELEGGFLDIASAISAEADEAHFYCCGPAPMIDAFERAAAPRPPEHVHVERFASDEAIATEGGFTVELARSGRSIRVTEGRTILETLQENQVEIEFSCLTGVCGSCRTTVLDGVPDHRDLILTRRERNKNDQMMVCCSGSKTDRLVLDL